MRAHIIENGIVTNTIEVELLDFMPNLIDADQGGAIGDLWDGTRFITPDPVAEVPQVVTMRQARLALLAAGKLDTVASAIASLPSPDKEEAQIEWEYSQTVERGRRFVAMLAPAIGLDSAGLDQLFITAATL